MRRGGWLMAAFLLGAWLRLDQLPNQVLTNDEWHAVNQLIVATPRQFLFSFGFSDHSIPLTLLYWFEAQCFGLSELGMRWPMLLAGLLTLILFPLWVSRRHGWRVALPFALLLAVSPLLINYSRYARPYALTLLLGYVAHYAFWRYWTRTSGGTRYGLLYGVCAGLSSWLHLVSLPFVMAPLILAGVPAARNWRRDGGEGGRRLLRLAVPSVLAIALLIGPPLLADPAALANKAGRDLPGQDAFVGVWHTWLGTPSRAAVLACLGLAVVGLPRLWRQEPLLKGALLGALLTLAVLLATQPSWLYHPLALGRYLLPAMIPLLLAVAVGTTELASTAERRWGSRVVPPVLLLPLVVLLVRTPLADTLRHPNSYTLHSTFQDDYRQDGRRERYLVRDIPLSPWWATLRARPPASVTIAVAPFQVYSPRWDAPRWEALGRQRVIPGFLAGLCLAGGAGEPPIDARFVLRNGAHLAVPEEMAALRVGLVVFQKPFPDVRGSGMPWVGADTAHCLDAQRARFGAPSYEDDKIVVFSVNRAVGPSVHAQ